jgi:glycosyltransferase involved in cell wall biosynthesis
VASTSEAPFFSIVISTRDRPGLFQIALQSVLEQSFPNIEVVVVIDGSDHSNLLQYRELEKEFGDISFFELEHRSIGHGQSYAMNYGVHKSSGQYLCFLDDDDHWTDAGYLERVYTSISSSEKTVDVHYSNQKAIFSNGEENENPVWIDDLIARVSTQDKHVEDSYFVNTQFLLSSGGFAHLNCSIFNREFYLSRGGMDETIRYENDRDIYIRSIDEANIMLFSTRYVSLHNIPDVSKKNNMSTVSSMIEKKLYQMRVFDKGISLSQNPDVVRFCCRAKMYELKHAARILAQNKQYQGAAHYAKAALGTGFNFRWLAYTSYLIVLAWLDWGSASNHDRR